MNVILDNLVATIIAGTILLILISVSHQRQMVAAEKVGYYAMRKQQLSFIDIMKRDMRNLTEAESAVQSPTDSTFSFLAYIDTTNTTIGRITYKYRRVGQRDTVDLHQVQRFVQPAAGGTQELVGMSMATLTGWEIEARSPTNVAVTDPANARRIYVRFEAATPFYVNSEANGIKRRPAISQVRWEASFSPPLLQQSQSI